MAGRFITRSEVIGTFPCSSGLSLFEELSDRETEQLEISKASMVAFLSDPRGKDFLYYFLFRRLQIAGDAEKIYLFKQDWARIMDVYAGEVLTSVNIYQRHDFTRLEDFKMNLQVDKDALYVRLWDFCKECLFALGYDTKEEGDEE